MSSSVGSLLADIANHIVDGLRIFVLSDKRQWGADEHELKRALEDVLDEAKKDFQELSPLVSGQSHYERDKNFQSIIELKELCARFQAHMLLLKDWSRSGGPVNPIWVRDTHALQRVLHRAQCRAAGRIFTTMRESSARCLGAFLVRRQQQASSTRRARSIDSVQQQRCLEELAICNVVGGFERFGEDDIAFICDFCDGHMVWEDLESMPTMRSIQQEPVSPPAPTLPTATNPHWQARGLTLTTQEEKQVAFAPLVIANHMTPRYGDWQARLMCPYCEEIAEVPQDQDDEEDPWRPDYEFEDLDELQEHLEWQHAPTSQASTLPVTLPSTGNCQIM